MVSAPRRGSRAPRAAPARDRSAFARVPPSPEAPGVDNTSARGHPRARGEDRTSGHHGDLVVHAGGGQVDSRRPPRERSPRPRHVHCSGAFTTIHTVILKKTDALVLQRVALSGSATRAPSGARAPIPRRPTRPSSSRRVFHARINGKSTNRQGKKRVSQRSRARRRDERRGVAREARARRPSRPDAGARAVIEKRHRRRAVPARVAVVAAAARGDSRRGDERGAASLPSSIGGGDVDKLLITCRPRRHLVS